MDDTIWPVRQAIESYLEGCVMERRRILELLTVGLLVIGLVTASATLTLNESTTVSNNDDGTVVIAGDGPAVTLVGNTDISPESGGVDNNTIQWITGAGNATFSSTGHSEVTVHKDNITGEWTTVSELNVTQNELTIDPEDKRAISVKGDTDYLKFRNAEFDDGDVDFLYRGSSGSTTVTVRGLPDNRGMAAVDAETGETLGVGVSDSSGTVTFDAMPNSEHRVEITSDANPILENPRPNGNVSTTPDELSVNVTDEDFPGDSVDVDFYIEGDQVDSLTTESNGRVSTTNTSAIEQGQNDWSVVATDENDNKDIVNATVGVPGTLYIRNETDGDELINSSVDVTVSFQNGSTITERTTGDGKIDMSGLPTTDFIVTAEADGYYSRTVWFENIIGDDSVYLLNETYNTTENRFVLEDPTGQFPSESVVIVKRAINQSGTNQYRMIYSDEFGTEGVTVDLHENKRYQLSIRNPDGTVQSVGPYRSDVSEEVTVRPGNPVISLDDYEGGWAANATVNDGLLEYRYDDPDGLTQQLTVTIVEKNNESNRLRPPESYYDVGTVSGVYNLTENETAKTWVVKFEIDRDGETFTVKEEVSERPDLTPPLSDAWRLLIGIGILIISAGVFSVLNASVGGVVVALEAGVLWWTGFLAGATTGAGVIIALFVAVIVHIYTSSGP